MSFLEVYILTVIDGLQYWHHNNFDTWRYGQEPENTPQVWQNEVSTAIRQIEQYLHFWEQLYIKLEDDQSREILVKTLAFRALGHRRIKLPLSTPEYFASINHIKTLCTSETLNTPSALLCKIDLHPIGVPLYIYDIYQNIVSDFILKQYSLDGIVQVTPGDIVVDVGACWGDTSLFLALQCGKKGHVYAVEFEQENLKILKRNLELNPDVASCVQIVESALWNKSGVNLSIYANGPGAQVAEGNGNLRSLALDDLGLKQIDFLKMDIEGAEMYALLGAEKLLKMWKPKLAITVYHKLLDALIITDYLQQFGYKFWLRHFSIHTEETVLFAKVE
jgi:FkbM family methyltransferase